MSNKKIFILLPDGVGRNFVFTDFYKKNGAMDSVLESHPFDLVHIGFEEIRLQNTCFLLEILKNARKEIELTCILESRKMSFMILRFTFHKT
jgi:uncharacterized protein Smg (DUF494 family)